MLGGGLMLGDIGQRPILYLDPEGEPEEIAYADLMIDMGGAKRLSLEQCLHEEGDRIEEFRAHARRLAGKLFSLTPPYRKHERTSAAWHAECRRRTRDIHLLSYAKRLRMLNSYYCVDRHHGKVLDALEEYVLAGSEGDHSPHVKSLIRFAIDYTICVLKDVPRKTGRPCALHSLTAARGVARNGQNHVTIIGTLLHDVLEERVDLWFQRFVREKAREKASGTARENARESAPDTAGEDELALVEGKIPNGLRLRVLREHADEYNTRAAAIYYAIGLALFGHVRKFPEPERYYQTLHSIMEMVDKLSRTSDLSYYEYLQRFLYPRLGEVDEIRRDVLVGVLSEEFDDPGPLLDEYLERVEGFYETPSGVFQSREEIKRNALREMLAKILDRMNNTRDMDRDLGFSIPKRLYGAGFKNIYFSQALEDRMALPGLPGNESRMISLKFIKKPKIAALYQTLDDIAYLEREFFGRSYVDMLETQLRRYALTPEFRRITGPRRGGLFDGTVYFFNDVALGNKRFLKDLEEQRDKQAEYLVVFRSVLESFLVYSAFIEQDRAGGGGKGPAGSRWKRYRIRGMGPQLSRRGPETANLDALPPILTFRRRVV